MDFATAASRLLAAHAGWRDRDLVATPRGLRAEAISLALRAYRVTLVRTLCTRLQLTSSGEDVTADAPSDDGSGAGSGAAGAASTSATSSAHNSAAAHDDAWYVDRKGSELLLLATAPAGLSREQLLAQAVCEVLGVDAPTSLAPLLAVDASQAAATLARLRRLLRQWRRRTLSHATWHATWHAIWPDGGPPGRWPARAYAVPLSTSALVPLDTARARRGERYDCRWRCRGRSRSRRRRRDAGRDAGFVNGCATRCADRRPLLR